MTIIILKLLGQMTLVLAAIERDHKEKDILKYVNVQLSAWVENQQGPWQL